MVELLPGSWAVWISTRAPQLWGLTQGGWVLLSWSEIYGDCQGGCKKPGLHSRRMYTHTCLLPKHGRSSRLEPWLPSAPQPMPSASPAPTCSRAQLHARAKAATAEQNTRHFAVRDKASLDLAGHLRTREPITGHRVVNQGCSGVLTGAGTTAARTPVCVKPLLWSSCPKGQLSTRAKAATAEEHAQLWGPGQAQAEHSIQTREGHHF